VDELKMNVNTVKQRLAAGQIVYGTWVSTVRNPAIIRMISAAGFQAVFIDTEHGAFSLETISGLCEMSRACGLVPIVRSYDRNGHLVNRIQDIGAMGMIFPHVESRSEVDDVLHWMHYPPDGERGSTSVSAPADYAVVPGDVMKRFINDNMLLAVQIESRQAVDNLDSILDGGGIDLIEVGRNDLSTSLGVPLEFRHPSVLEAVDHVIATCRKHGIAVGTNCKSVDDAADMMKRGIQHIAYSSDRHILTGAYYAAIAGLNKSAVENGLVSA
jgi:2-keto-3-deoxy-L-rhamnonate aldolase RhmA